MAHIIVKPEKIVGLAAPLVTQELVLPNLMRKETLEKYKGTHNDTLTFWVPGNLPARDYAWRNNRAAGIVFDEYAETKITLTAGGNAYSAVRLTDEQADMDLDGWDKLLTAQSKAVANKLNHAASDALEAAPYEVVLKGLAVGNLKANLIKARSIQNRFGAGASRIAVIGTDLEEALLSDPAFTIASNVGDSVAEGALRDAVIGKLYGYTFVVDVNIGPKDGYLFSDDAYVYLSMVPSPPRGAPYSATTSYDGVAMRWICDYDTEYMRDRSLVNTYYGFQPIVDQFEFWDKSVTPTQAQVQASQHFVRAIKITMTTGTNVLPAANSDVHKATGVSA